MSRGIDVETLNINKSKYEFTPDQENNKILFGLKAVQGMNGEFAEEIVANAPYDSMQDFIERMNPNKTTTINLIKAGAFDEFGSREECMNEYIYSVCNPKKRITLQNFNGLQNAGLIPESLEFPQRVWNFDKMMKKHMKFDSEHFKLEGGFYDFYNEFFDTDYLKVDQDGNILLSRKEWKKMYDAEMKKVKAYFQEHQQELLDSLNGSLFQEEHDKYAQGSISKWEMDSLGYYSHEHELAKVKKNVYNIWEYGMMSDTPEVAKTFNRNGSSFPIFRTHRIVGTVVGKDTTKSTVNLLTVHDGVITVKMNREYFAYYNRQISSPDEEGINKVREKGWFTRGNKIMVNGFRRDGMFVCKAYKNDNSHQLYLITDVLPDGSMVFTHNRWGEEEE